MIQKTTGTCTMATSTAAAIISCFTALFAYRMVSRSFSPIRVDRLVAAPFAIRAEITPNASVAGYRMLTADSALLPTRLPTTSPSTDMSRSVERFVMSIVGIYSSSFRRVSDPVRVNRSLIFIFTFLLSFVLILLSPSNDFTFPRSWPYAIRAFSNIL